MTSSAPPEVKGLEGVRVLEFPDLKTALCGRLLSQMGADVVLVEPPDGSPLRKLPPLAAGPGGESLWAWSTQAGKRSIAADVEQEDGRAVLLDLVRHADVLLDPFPPGRLASLGLTEAALFDASPSLVLASVTNFGQTGPFRDYASSDIVGWAMGGLMGLTGDPEREPLNAPALQGYQVGSLWATIGVQAALYRRLKTGQRARLDISLQEAVFDMSETAHSFYLANGEVVKRGKGEHPLACPFRVYPAKDGYVFVAGTSQQQWQTLLDWMDSRGIETERLRDPALTTSSERLKRREEINTAVSALTKDLPQEELFLTGAERRMANAPVRRISEVPNDDQLVDRRFFGSMPDPREGREGLSYPYPGLPFRGRSGQGPSDPSPPPRAGQHTGEVKAQWESPGRAWPEPETDARLLPLEGTKIADLCWNIAGPVMGRVLADLGATVIKAEPREIGDPSRMLVPFPDRTPGIERSYSFHDINRNKLSMTVDMRRPKARGLAMKIAAWADVFLENFSGGTMTRLGVPYDALSEANPRLVFGSITGYGQTGPRRSWPSYHPTSAALSGLTGLFGYEGGEPEGFGNSYMDYVTGYLGAIGVVDGLFRREVTGRGDHVDVSQLESGVTMVAKELLEWAVNGNEPRPVGNQAGALGAALQGCFRCRGDDKWIVVTAPDEAAMQTLKAVVGSPETASVGQAEEALARWASGRDPWDAFEALQQEGVAAGVVSTGHDMTERDPHLAARRAVSRLPHPELGQVPIAECPIILDGERLVVRAPAALLGEHTESFLREDLGISEDAYLEHVLEEII